jgi:biotin transport system substrate-specific component
MPAPAATARPMIAGVLPKEGNARLAAQVALALSGTLLLALSAKTKLELGPVDLSLQTLAVMLLAAAYGLRLGVATLLLYLFEGSLFLPVFQGEGAGLPYMVGPTGGYLAGFVAMAAITGWAADRGWDRSLPKFLAALLAAEVVMTALGYGWLALLIGADKAWTAGVLPFVVPDLVKLCLAAALVPAVWGLPFLRRA